MNGRVLFLPFEKEEAVFSKVCRALNADITARSVLDYKVRVTDQRLGTGGRKSKFLKFL